MLKEKNIIAVDLSSSDLKIAQLNTAPGKKEIINLVTQRILNLSDDDISKIIRQQLKDLQIVKPRVIVVIPSFLSLTKNIEIPSSDQNEIKEIINLQASRHTPYSREEIIIDYINIGMYKKNYTKVLLVIVTRSVIRKQLEILGKAGLIAERVTFSSEGVSYLLSRSLRLSSLDTPAGILHLDEGYTDFMITEKGKVIFIRSIPIGSQHLLAEKEKYESKFAEEIKNSLEVYSNEDIGRVPCRVILTGAIDAMEYLAGLLSSSLNVPIDTFFYMRILPISGKGIKSASIHTNRQSFLSVIATLFTQDELKLDLVPEEIRLEKIFRHKSREIIKTGILVMIVFVLIYCILLTRIFIKSSYLNRLATHYKSKHIEAQRLQGQFTKSEVIRGLLLERGFCLEVLSELYSKLPLDMQVAYIKFEDSGAFSIEGTAESMATVFSFTDNLRESKYFTKVEPRYTTRRKEDDKDLTDFKLDCRLSDR